MQKSPLQKISLDDIQFIGRDLVRPECVLSTQAGNIYVSDFRGGVSCILPNGEIEFFGGHEVEGFSLLKPNGICIDTDGSFLIAHLGDDKGGVFRIDRYGKTTPWLLNIEGTPLPPCNFIYRDHQNRYWLTVSTRKIPRAAAYRSDISDGFIVVIDEHGPRIVADNIGYTNEVYVSPDGTTLYANATFARETLSFDVVSSSDNKTQLENKKCVAKYGMGIYPDGLTMDTEGYLWVTSIVSNSVLRVNPTDGSSALVLQDVDQGHLQWVEDAFIKHEMGRPHLDGVESARLHNISSLAFGGSQLNTIYLGCLLGTQVATSTSHHTGVPPSHWHIDD